MEEPRRYGGYDGRGDLGWAQKALHNHAGRLEAR